MNSDQSTVAIYWDFENIHASILDKKNGPGAYKQSRFTSQDQVVDVEALMEFAASLGSVAINQPMETGNGLPGIDRFFFITPSS